MRHLKSPRFPTTSLLSAGLRLQMLVLAASWALTMVPVATAAPLRLEIVDALAERIACRIVVRPMGADCLVPQGTVELEIGPDRWFMSDGAVSLEVPPGRVEVRVERGLEFRRIKRILDVPSAGLARSFTLNRWIDLGALGYRSGENHLHVDARSLAPMLVCEGLDFGTSLTWWRGPDERRPIPPGAGHIRDLDFAGRVVPTSVFDAELEYGWGAAYLTGGRRPLSLEAEPGRPNLDYLHEGVASGAIVHYQGGWSREVLVDALLGLVHTVNVCNNNFGLHRFQPRSRYSNLLDVEGHPVYPNTEEGMMRLNTDSYYRLLNCGLRLAAGAGSATGVKGAPVGYNRTYVRMKGDSTIDEFYQSWAAGRNFVTNGPVTLLHAGTGARPGDEIALGPGGGRLRFHASVLSDCPLTSAEIVVNGEVRHSFAIDDPHELESHVDLDISEGAWIALRATARDDLLTDEELAAHTVGDGDARFPIRPARLRFAHTSPIYVTVGGSGPRVSDSLEEARAMLDKFEEFAARNALDAYRPGILRAVAEARQRLVALANGAPAASPDP